MCEKIYIWIDCLLYILWQVWYYSSNHCHEPLKKRQIHKQSGESPLVRYERQFFSQTIKNKALISLNVPLGSDWPEQKIQVTRVITAELYFTLHINSYVFHYLIWNPKRTAGNCIFSLPNKIFNLIWVRF